jgi:hypothetical protein
VGEAQQARGAGPVTIKVAAHDGRVASPMAVLLAALGLVLAAAWVLLTSLTGDLQASRDGAAFVFALACGLLGMLVVRRQPRNPEGWLLLGPAVWVMVVLDSGLYAVFDYRIHHGHLPLGYTAVLLRGTIGDPLVFVFALVILLFPEGRLTRRWKWVLWAYLFLVVVATVGLAANEVGTIAGQHIQVDLNGTYSGPSASMTGVIAGVLAYGGAGLLLVPLFWPAFAARQVLSWRRSTGERRQQLKWLTSGSVVALAGLALIALGPSPDQVSGRVSRDLAFLALAALPLSIAVGILKYHLYDIDRLISRTLAYTLVTGLLIGVYAGIVTFATRVLPFSSPVGVAASTLSVAALFNPLRRRVQRIVDRRFNRARYNAETVVAAFAARLKDAVDLDLVRDDLAGVVQQTLEPAHVSVWMSERG